MNPSWITKIRLLCGFGLVLCAPAALSTPGHAADLPTAQKGAAAMQTIDLWPGIAPGEKGDIGEEKDTTPPEEKNQGDKYIIRQGNVTRPTLTVYRPAKDKDTGTAVVVCPGGGYQILALNLEGSEVCEWLNSIGVTAFLLKYRVPGRKGLERYTAALQDAQRALGLVRSGQKNGVWTQVAWAYWAFQREAICRPLSATRMRRAPIPP